MQTAVLIVHVLLAIAVIGLVLIQQGKGADAGAAFGSGSSATVFGAGGSGSFLTRMTTALATLFFVTSLALAVMAAHRTGDSSSVVDRAPASSETGQPAANGDSGTMPAEDMPAGAGEDKSKSGGDMPPIDQ